MQRANEIWARCKSGLDPQQREISGGSRPKWTRTFTYWRSARNRQRSESDLRWFRVKLGGSFGGLLFPSKSDRDVPVRRDVFGRWFSAAEANAKLPKLDGSLWHAYRRARATARKDLPLKDVAATGGWSEVGTLLRCDQQPDDDTIEIVMSIPERSARK